MKRILPILLLLLSACAESRTPVEPARLPEKTKLPTLKTTNTRVSYNTPDSTFETESTPLPLQTEGPYLISLNDMSGGFYFHLLDADGSGQKDIIPSDGIQNQVNESGFIFTVELSEDGRWIGFVGGDHYYLFDVANEEFVHLSRFANIYAGLSKYDIELGLSFSGDSKWLVFLDGEDIESCSNPEPYPCRVYLNVMRLADQKIVWRTNILPADFPNNFERLLDSIIGLPAEERESVYAGVMATFYGGVGYLAWSPDSANLAFAGAIDGPTTDVYAYNPEHNMLTRLTDGLGNVTFLKWTSDSRYIMHYSSARSDCSPGCGTYYIVDLEGKPAREILPDYCGDYASLVGWVGPTTVLCTGGEWENRLVRYDFLTEGKNTIFEYLPELLVVNQESGMILAGISEKEQTPKRKPGYYLLDLQSGSSKRLPLESYCLDPERDDPPFIESISFRQFQFHINCTSGSLFVDLQGTTAFLPDLRFDVISSSPNQEWLLGFDGVGKMYIISSELKLEHEIPVEFQKTENGTIVYAIYWREDGRGFFYHSILGLSYADMETGETKLVDPDEGLVLGWAMKE